MDEQYTSIINILNTLKENHIKAIDTALQEHRNPDRCISTLFFLQEINTLSKVIEDYLSK